ncbi:MAG TPA: 50S ribosomal protein L21 [Actinomycetota bacterium]|jgi:large subunit ribosomal protein L21|nr:50S ribosomal protein L21 [Actinomycetota bacterium]
MYAVIRAGGKQHKVAPGDVIQVERLGREDGTVEFTPLLVVDDAGDVTAGGDDLAEATVTARVVGETKGTKLHVLKYRNKVGYRRKTGHRQKYTTLEIGDIKLGASRGSKKESK